MADKYYDVADLVRTEDGAAINVCVGLCVLAGIAAGEAITAAAATGEQHSGSDHAAAATLLGRVDETAGRHLKKLVELKPLAHYGDGLLRAKHRKVALASAIALVEEARARTKPSRPG